MKRLNKKGFTMAELLIVVAIIAVLVAIAIPVFTAQLEKSRDAVTISNLRAAYAEAQSAYLTGSNGGNATVTTDSNGKITKVVVAHVASKGAQDGFSNLETELSFTAPEAMGNTAKKYSVTFNYDANGAITSVTATAE